MLPSGKVNEILDRPRHPPTVNYMKRVASLGVDLAGENTERIVLVIPVYLLQDLKQAIITIRLNYFLSDLFNCLYTSTYDNTKSQFRKQKS